jgi:diguanylate cyclase (GGDEF)-like protein
MHELYGNDFEKTASEVLSFLHRRLGFDLWMITRTEGNDWIVLQSEDHGYGVKSGRVFRWVDSFCAEMVKGKGPHFAPTSKMVPAYAAAPIGQQVTIGAYIAIPLLLDDGSLFGTLCAIDPEPQPQSIIEDQALVELMGRLLSRILQMELKAEELVRRAERFEAQALTDAMTGLYNRAGWDQLMTKEEGRCRRHGSSCAVIIVDLDALKQVNDAQGHTAGDDLIVRTAKALHQAARAEDVVARLGGDEFGIIGVNCDRAGGDALRMRVLMVFDQEGIMASVGWAMRDPGSGISQALVQADQKMYENKRLNKHAGQVILGLVS